MELRRHDLEFTRDGIVFEEDQLTGLIEAAADASDLLILCHGWNNDMAEAAALYDGICTSIGKVIGSGIVPAIEPAGLMVAQLFWPSKRFTDKELIPGGGAASATIEDDTALRAVLAELKRNPQRLGGEGDDPVRAASVNAAIALVSQLDADPKARETFVLHLRAILDPSQANADDGSDAFFNRDTEALFRDLSDPVEAPGASLPGGAQPVAAEGAAGLKDMLSGIKAAARRIANYTTYYEMKQRSGVVGRAGLAPVILRLRARNAKLRLHLVGHSFGARLVTSAASNLPPAMPGLSLTLLQAAFSHNAFSADYDGEGRHGAFRTIFDKRQIAGPIVVTHTKNDNAVGIAYPIASRFAHDPASALGDRDDPYGGLGRNGALHMAAEGHDGELLALGRPYAFGGGAVFNLNADATITSHGDIEGPEVAYAILNAIAAVPR